MGWIVLVVILGIVVLAIAGNLLGWLLGIIFSILSSTAFWVVVGIAAVAIVVHVIRRDDDADYGYEKDDEEPTYGQDHTYIPPEDADRQDPDSKPQYDMQHPRSYILPPDSWDILDGPSLLDHGDDDKKDKKD